MRHIYRALDRSAADSYLRAASLATIPAALDPLPVEGQLRAVVAELGGRGASQVAQIIQKAGLVPH